MDALKNSHIETVLLITHNMICFSGEIRKNIFSFVDTLVSVPARGSESYKRALILLNSLNELRKRDKIAGFSMTHIFVRFDAHLDQMTLITITTASWWTQSCVRSTCF